MIRIRTLIALALCLAGIFLAVLLLSKHHGVPVFGEAIMAACGAGEGCDVVSQSRYAIFLGLPLAGWGLFFYGSLFALLLPLAASGSEERKDQGSLAFALVAAALVLDVALLFLQAFVIKAFCKFCIATYVVNAGLLASLWPFRKPSSAAAFVFGAENRSAFAAWIAAVVAVLGMTASANAALADRRALAGQSILGTPPLLQAPARTPAPGSIEEQLAAAQAEAKKWKDTLDNDRKLQVYLVEKAKRDFNEAQVEKLDLSRAPSQGTKNGPLHVVTFSDFMCPFCRDLAAGLKNFLPNSANVQSHYKHYPLDTACNSQLGRTVHPGSCEFSLAGICAEGMGHFWEFHDKVFARTWDTATREDVLQIAASAGLDRVKMGTCMDSTATKGLLAKDIEEGWRAGVAGSTPTVFINGRKVESTNYFFLALEEERKRLGLPAQALSGRRPQ